MLPIVSRNNAVKFFVILKNFLIHHYRSHWQISLVIFYQFSSTLYWKTSHCVLILLCLSIGMLLVCILCVLGVFAYVLCLPIVNLVYSGYFMLAFDVIAWLWHETLPVLKMFPFFLLLWDWCWYKSLFPMGFEPSVEIYRIFVKYNYTL